MRHQLFSPDRAFTKVPPHPLHIISNRTNLIPSRTLTFWFAEGADTTLQLFSLGYDLLSTLVAGALIWTVQKRLGGNEHVVMVPKKSS